MTINAHVFNKLFDFVEQFPHYFIGSNADLIFGRNNTSMGIVWLCFGSTFLCPAPLYLKKNKENLSSKLQNLLKTICRKRAMK